MKELFKIFTVNHTDVEHIKSAPDEPHIHNYEELVICIEGEIEHFIDFKNTFIDAPLISFISKGKLHRLIPKIKDGKFLAWIIRFKSEFIAETIFQLYSYYHDHANIKMQHGECFNRMVVLCEMMYRESLQIHPDYAVIRHLLCALFTMIESERKKNKKDEISINNTQTITFKNFLQVLEENFRRDLGVEFYAEKLFMSTRNLNIICQNILQKSVSEIIETRKLIEAKNLLIYTNKTVSEIGYELGYNEKAYFTKVFKKKAGQTPTEFREEVNKLIS